MKASKPVGTGQFNRFEPAANRLRNRYEIFRIWGNLAKAETTLLSIDEVHVHFGGIVALDGISFAVEEGQILGLIGPNGAGKTTLFNCLTRLYGVDKGDIRFQGRSILDLPPYRITPLGIGRTFQNLALFTNISVLDNVLVGLHSRIKSDFLTIAWGLPWAGREERAARETAMELISYLGLEEVMHQSVAELNFGTLKRVELARALASRPKLLLLDEPAGGLNHEEVERLGEIIKDIRDQRKTTVLLVEHHMSLVMQVSDRVVALNFGQKLAEGTPAQVRKNKKVIQAYLGDGTA